MENIEVAYQIFYKQCEYSTKETKLNIRRTGTDRITFAPGSTRTLETVTVSIRDGKILGRTYYTRPSGDTVGTPTRYLRDRPGGLYLCVSKKDASGKSIEREYMVGDVPEKEDWAAYTTLGEKLHRLLFLVNHQFQDLKPPAPSRKARNRTSRCTLLKKRGAKKRFRYARRRLNAAAQLRFI